VVKEHRDSSATRVSWLLSVDRCVSLDVLCVWERCGLEGVKGLTRKYVDIGAGPE
jgi:hypothetical protein